MLAVWEAFQALPRVHGKALIGSQGEKNYGSSLSSTSTLTFTLHYTQFQPTKGKFRLLLRF